MIKSNIGTKKCTMIGKEDDILIEFSMIVYGLREACYSEDDICKAVGEALARFDINKYKEKGKKK